MFSAGVLLGAGAGCWCVLVDGAEPVCGFGLTYCHGGVPSWLRWLVMTEIPASGPRICGKCGQLRDDDNPTWHVTVMPTRDVPVALERDYDEYQCVTCRPPVSPAEFFASV